MTASTPGLGVGPILVIALAILTSLFAAAAVSAAPTDLSRVAMVFPPWWSANQAITAAAGAGDILGVGGVPFVVIVHPNPARADHPTRSNGALFILRADLGGLCSSAPLDVKS